MKKRYWMVAALILVLAVALTAAACGGTTTTTTAAPATTTTGAAATTTTAAGATTTTAAGSTTTAAANTTPLKFGIAISLTGDSAAPCGQIKEGFDTEAKYVNANGGINGRQVQLIYADDKSTMDGASAAIQALVDDKCDIIIGPFPQWTQAPTRALTNKAQILQIAFGPPLLAELNNTDQSASDWTYYFEPATGADGCSDAFVREMQADGRKNVLGVGDNMTISQETLKVLAKSLPASGVNFTLMSDTYGLSTTDFTAIASKIAAEVKKVNPDAIILCSNPVAVNPLEAKLHSLGVKVPIYNQGSGAHPVVMLKAAGNDPANVAGDYCIGPAIVDPSQVPDTYTAKADLVAFLARWKADNPKEPFASLFLGFAYDTFHLAQQAITSATTQDEAGWAAAMTKIDWVGAQGEYKFSTTDHVGGHGGFFQWQYTNGQGFKYIRDLNAMSSPTLLPATVAAVQALK